MREFISEIILFLKVFQMKKLFYLMNMTKNEEQGTLKLILQTQI